jgi:phage gpG-like protein
MPRISRSDFPDFQKMQGDFQRIIGSLPAVVGNAMVNFYKDSWNREGFLDQRRTPWPPRKGRQMKRRRLLVQTGRLRRSLRYSTQGTLITISTDVPYAQVHNEGGKVQGTQNVKQHTRKTKRGATTVKAHTRAVNFTMPQRQFMDIPGRRISAVLEKRIQLIVQRAFDAALKKHKR